MISKQTKAIGDWLWEARYCAVASLTIVAAVGFSLSPGSTEQRIRLTGLFLQLIGIYSVFWGIRKTRAFFQTPSSLMTFRNWARRFPLRRRDAIVGVLGITLDAAVGSARGHSRHVAGLNASESARIEALEKNLDLIDQRISNLHTKVEKSDGAIKSELRDEKIERESEINTLKTMIEDLSTGGLDISAMGAVFLLVGVILSTAAIELDRLVALVW
jgi:hypothetical protein